LRICCRNHPILLGELGIKLSANQLQHPLGEIKKQIREPGIEQSANELQHPLAEILKSQCPALFYMLIWLGHWPFRISACVASRSTVRKTFSKKNLDFFKNKFKMQPVLRRGSPCGRRFRCTASPRASPRCQRWNSSTGTHSQKSECRVLLTCC
jgi:hypothetical protein